MEQLQDIFTHLISRKKLQRGLICADVDLLKVTTKHATLFMYGTSHLHREFELEATSFWRDWDTFETLLQRPFAKDGVKC
jgi:hypothetical protein